MEVALSLNREILRPGLPGFEFGFCGFTQPGARPGRSLGVGNVSRGAVAQQIFVQPPLVSEERGARIRIDEDAG